MSSENLFNQFFRQVNETLLPGAQALTGDMQQHLKTAMMAAFDKMDLVTREEFDAQRAVLSRTREKLDKLEAQVIELEARLDKGNKK